nr:uncharacterized protein BNAC08G06420D [Ipomoea trifida]
MSTGLPVPVVRGARPLPGLQPLVGGTPDSRVYAGERQLAGEIWQGGEVRSSVFCKILLLPELSMSLLSRRFASRRRG